jgi:bifunctional enzyme CysN/CysC
MSVLQFITCGSVDDGKSTLIGRLLWESRQLCDDQIASLESDSRRFGTQGDHLDFALLVDGLTAEREQGITIDVAHRYFSSPHRQFIVADTPGHEQYTRNMVTAASDAQAAILLVDARKGIQTQTRRHAFLCSLMGIRHLALAVNKMDLIDFDHDRFTQIQTAFLSFVSTLDFASVTAIPVSALLGDNIIERSARCHGYHGPTLMAWLDTTPASQDSGSKPIFPVQWVNRPDGTFRGFCGTVAQGTFLPGQTIRVSASGQTAIIQDLISFDGKLPQASENTAVTMTLDRDIDISRGDVLASATQPVETSDQFEAWLVWMSDESGLTGRHYDLKLATQWSSASITSIKHRVNVNSMAHESARTLEMNDIAVCNLALGKAVAFEPYAACRTLGAFILVDRFTHATVGAGMIRHSLRRAQNVHRQSLSIERTERERLNGHPGRVIWLTGLSGAGKSTLANAVVTTLHERGYHTYLLDGDNIRQGINKDLGFTDADRTENIRRVAEIARLMMDAGLVVLTSFISPFRQEREMARTLIGENDFFEIFVSTSLATCEQRDPKGLYRKARAGQLPNMTGIGSPYEPPEQPFLQLDLGLLSLDAAVQTTLEALQPALAVTTGLGLC